MTDWQPHEDLTHGGSSPAGDWREPMVDTSNSSNPTEIGSPPPGRWAAAWKRAASKFRSWQSDTEADTEAALEQERRAVDVLADALVMSGSCMLGYDHTSLSDCSRSTNCRACWAAWARAETLPST